jgi:hypothetical protein
LYIVHFYSERGAMQIIFSTGGRRFTAFFWHSAGMVGRKTKVLICMGFVAFESAGLPEI